ncbi:tuftelin 1b isoform X1 [Takifugu rubripes]|uniref:tuftelin 1b isoform X1 n=2 Tax=Takifugu rubripes TaxID=31033 RepID=UPI00114575FD|nr:tuftelin-like isoform X1 [Takifugu rubripes]
MGSFWKKMLRLSGAKGLTHGADFNASEMEGAVVCAVGEGEDSKAKDHRRCLQNTRQDQDQAGCTSEQHDIKESSIAVVLPHKPEEREGAYGLTPTDERAEVIKVFLGAHPQTGENIKMITDEVSQIQEVRYCLKSLREQMAARQNNNNKNPVNGLRVDTPAVHTAVANGNAVLTDSDDHVKDNQQECVRLREATRRLYVQLKEMEKRHQEERDRLQAESELYGIRLAEQSERLQEAEKHSEERGQRVEELQRLLARMEVESSVLKEKMVADEAELLQLKAGGQKTGGDERRCAELEKEVAILKEKIHQLDDMLKSQQRKVRHMIEQLQNSRTIIQERDRVIRDLEEKVAFLEAENREMHDHMEYFLEGQDPPPLSNNNKPEIVYSKPLTPTTQSSKALPFIKVIEIKS